MSWINISNYMSRFKDFKPSRETMQRESAKIISDIIDFDITHDELEYRSGTLFIKIKNPGFKSQVLMNKNKILKTLAERLGSKSPKDIKF